MQAGDKPGFTIPELLVVIVVLAAMLGGATLLLRPASYSAAEHAAQRRLGLAGIGQALKRYKAHNGHWPEGIPVKTTAIASYESNYDLCPSIVPRFIDDMPLDPVTGVRIMGDDTKNLQLTDQPCNEQGVSYATGFTIKRNADNSIALAVAQNEKISGPTAQLHLTVR